MSQLTRAALRFLSAPGVSASFYPFMRGRATIFMLHRFRMPDLGVEGTDPAQVRAALELLRRRRYELVGLAELFRRLRGEGPPLRRAIAFTIDDGYVDHAKVAAPVFAAFDCPVTTFVTTGFLDGTLWFWWDRIEYVLTSTRHGQIRLRVGGDDITIALGDRAARRPVIDAFTARCKALKEPDKLAAIDALATAAEVALPAKPPAACAPMSWDELKSCERSGMSFGAHTLTHPILARCDDAQARREISGSWDRLRQEAANPVPVFCYPNGGWGDFGEREIGILRDLGFDGAVVGAWGLAEARAVRHNSGEAFRVRRIAMPDSLPLLIQYASGLEQLKLALRRQ